MKRHNGGHKRHLKPLCHAGYLEANICALSAVVSRILKLSRRIWTLRSFASELIPPAIGNLQRDRSRKANFSLISNLDK